MPKQPQGMGWCHKEGKWPAEQGFCKPQQLSAERNSTAPEPTAASGAASTHSELLLVPSFPEQIGIYLKNLAGLFLPFLWLFSHVTELCITAGFCPVIQILVRRSSTFKALPWQEGGCSLSAGGKEAWDAKKMESGSFQCTQGQDKRHKPKQRRCCLNTQDASAWEVWLDKIPPEIPSNISHSKILWHYHRLQMSTDGQATTGKAVKSLCRLKLSLVSEKPTTTSFFSEL